MSSTIFTPFTEEQLIPKEEKLEVLKKEKNLALVSQKKPVYTKKTVYYARCSTSFGRTWS